MTLSSWLAIDAISRFGIMVMFLLSAAVTAFSHDRGVKLGRKSFLILFLYSFFQLSWMITGSVIYWGDLDKMKECDAMTIGYMYAILILGFFSFISNGLVGIANFMKLKE